MRKIRIIHQKNSTGAQQASWPSLQGGDASASPVALPTEPKAELIQDPGGATKIVVSCTCGKRIEIICES